MTKHKRLQCTKLCAVFVLAAGMTLSGPVLADDTSDFEKSMIKFLEKDENVEKLGSALERYAVIKRKRAAEQEQKNLEEQFKNPIKIDITNSPVKGKKDAKIEVVEFSDFQCPFCKRGAKTAEDLLKEYPDDVKLVFKHLPLPFHPQAKPAARASIAAHRQGKFWEMHDLLFANQNKLDEQTFVGHAEALGLDMEKFKADMKNAEIEKIIEDDVAIATKHGIRGTPGYFVHGVQVRGARPLSHFKDLVERWKKELGS